MGSFDGAQVMSAVSSPPVDNLYVNSQFVSLVFDAFFKRRKILLLICLFKQRIAQSLGIFGYPPEKVK